MQELSRNPKMVLRALQNAPDATAAVVPDEKQITVQKALNKAKTLAKRAPIDEPFMPRDRASSVIQAAMDLHMQNASARVAISDDVRFTDADPGWTEVLAALLARAFTKDAEFKTHTNTSDFQINIPDQTTIALFADWGTGRPIADAVGAQITALDAEYHIHLGDVYYAGFAEEIQGRFISKLPTSTKLKRRFGLNGNHEMYSGGHGYFEHVLPAFGQEASYFCLQNANWRIIGLDSAYKDQQLQDPQLDWLKAQLVNDGKKNVVLTHHQLFSCFEDTSDKMLKQVGPLLDAGRIHAWFWGHEHVQIVYLKQRNVAARCIGNGAIPYLPPGKDFLHPENKVQFVNRRIREDSVQAVNGFAFFELNGPRLHVRYIDEDGKEQFSEDLEFVISH